MQSTYKFSKEREVMNVRLAVAFLAVASTTGCLVVDTTRASGDVHVSWTFEGSPCSAVPSVTAVKISIPGETLANGGVYACTTNGLDGITLTSFAGGFYSFTITGLSSNNTE